MTAEPPKMSGAKPLLSIVVPCFNEEANLHTLHARVCAALDRSGVGWELIAVDDHSRDRTFEVLTKLSAADPRVRGLRLARNVGSHLAIICGIEQARGDAVAILAADLQDPPETLIRMLELWRQGAQIVWAVREKRLGISLFERMTSRAFNLIMAQILRGNRVVADGADFFLIDAQVAQALLLHREANISVFSLLQWMGYRQDSIYYVKEARTEGRSGWTFRKKMKFFIDSIVSFTFWPIRFLSLFGISVAMVGFLYSLIVIVNYFLGDVPSGWSSMIIVVLILGGTQIVMLGVLGEYLWRNLAETRQRPRYLIENRVGWERPSRAGSGRARPAKRQPSRSGRR